MKVNSYANSRYVLLSSNVCDQDPVLTMIMQLIPGHEVVGVVESVGKNVTGFAKGDRCVADPGITVSLNP